MGSPSTPHPPSLQTGASAGDVEPHHAASPGRGSEDPPVVEMGLEVLRPAAGPRRRNRRGSAKNQLDLFPRSAWRRRRSRSVVRHLVEDLNIVGEGEGSACNEEQRKMIPPRRSFTAPHCVSDIEAADRRIIPILSKHRRHVPHRIAPFHSTNRPAVRCTGYPDRAVGSKIPAAPRTVDQKTFGPDPIHTRSSLRDNDVGVQVEDHRHTCPFFFIRSWRVGMAPAPEDVGPDPISTLHRPRVGGPRIEHVHRVIAPLQVDAPSRWGPGASRAIEQMGQGPGRDRGAGRDDRRRVGSSGGCRQAAAEAAQRPDRSK